MKSKEELEKEPMPYDNETPKKCPKCGNWFLNYPALSRRDNKTYICPDCGVKEAMEDYMSSRKKEGLEEATAKALLEDPENESLTKPLTESVDWSYYNKFEDLINKYMPDEGEGETLASQIVTAVNKLIYKWYNDGDVFDNVNSGLNGWANDLSDYANWLYKYAPGDTPHILKRIYDITNEDDYEVLLRELADNLLDENLLNSLEKNKQGSIYDCDGPFEFSIYDEDEDEDEWDDYEEDSYEDEEDLDESKKLNEGVNNLIIKTGLTDKNAYDVLRSVEGQLADGIWENSPGMSRFWQYMSIDYEGSEVVARFDTKDYSSGFKDKDESQIKKWLANKVKQIVKEEGLDWDRNNTERVSYMHGNVTVQDAYRVYDKLLGRKDYIPDPNKKEESKEIDDIESEYRQAIDRAFDIMKLYGKDNKYYRKAVKKEKDLQKQLHDLKALKNESKEVMKKELNKDELLNKLEDYVLNQYTIFNDKLYDDFGDIQLNDKDNTKRSIYIYYDIEEDKISVTVGAAGARTFVDTLDEVAQFINAEIAKVNAQDEEIKKSVEESIDKDHDEYLKKMDKKYKTFCKNLEITDDPDDALSALDELEGQFGDEDGEYQELREFIYNELLESKEVKTESSDINLEKNEKVAGIYYQGTDINSLENSSKCNKYKIGEIIGNVVPSRVHGDYTVKSGPYKIIGYGSKQKDGKGEGFYIVIGLKGYVTVEKGKLYAKQDNLTSISKLRENGEAINYNYSFSMVESKKAISKKNFTDEEIRKAIRADIKEHNGLFTDDSKYDVIERLTGIADIDEQPEGLWERVDKIYETEFEKVNKKEENKLVEADDNSVIARMNKLLEIKEELVDFIKNTTCDTIKNNDIVKAAENIRRILNFQNWVEGQVEDSDRIYNDKEYTASKRYSREEYIDHNLQHNEPLMKELISLEDMLIK